MLAMAACLPTFLSDWIIEWLNINFYEKYGDKPTADWVRNFWKPEIDLVINTFTIPFYYRPGLMIKLAGVLLKTFAGLGWQENVFPLFKSIYGNENATKFFLSFIPFINWFGSRLTGYPQTDEAMATSSHVYPGSDSCNLSSPHAFWHEQSAHAFTEIILFLDDLYGSIVTNAD